MVGNPKLIGDSPIEMGRAHCYEKKDTLNKGQWSPEEDQKLMAYIKRYGIWNWRQMPKPAGRIKPRKWLKTLLQNVFCFYVFFPHVYLVRCMCMCMYSYFLFNFPGLSRSGKSCRLRWMNYLRPDIKRGNFTREEEETICRMQEMLGNK